MQTRDGKLILGFAAAHTERGENSTWTGNAVFVFERGDVAAYYAWTK